MRPFRRSGKVTLISTTRSGPFTGRRTVRRPTREQCPPVYLPGLLYRFLFRLRRRLLRLYLLLRFLLFLFLLLDLDIRLLEVLRQLLLIYLLPLRRTLLLHLFLIPALPGSGPEVRGNGEMYPLNGPTWSLFFEYIGNLCYALFLRRLSTRWLAAFVSLTGLSLVAFAVGNGSGYGHLGVGWSLADWNLPGGLLRMLFAFPMGLLLSRVFRPVPIRGAFWICSLAVVALLLVPYVGDSESLWTNGLYDSLCVVVLFPFLVWLGASGKATDRATAGVCKFLGDISYPVYVIHYPFMYLFFAWLWGGETIPFTRAWPVAAGIFIGCVVLAYAALKWYDEPVRRWLARRYLTRK